MEQDTKTLQTPAIPRGSAPRRAVRIVRSPDDGAIGRALPLDGSIHVLGRGGSPLGTIKDPYLSRTHARISGDMIEDLGGRNGTFLRGEPLEAKTRLAPGDVIAFGETLLVFDEEPAADKLPCAETAFAPANASESGLEREIAGISYAAERLRGSIATVAPAAGSVLLLGPSGAGKEVAARAVHRLSGRKGSWVPVNCAAVPAELAEAELFGHKKGAFTGAAADRPGYFARADGGTLFLDEVGDLPAPVQAKLLRVLEDRLVQPLGGGGAVAVDVRVIAATNKDLDPSGFRSDLLARLGDWTLQIPSLSERLADVLVLWDHFTSGGTCTALFAEALLLHGWPLNVRELQKLASRLSWLKPPDDPYDLPLLPEALRAAVRRDQKKESGGPDREAVVAAFTAAKGNVTEVARMLGCQRTQVYRFVRRFRIDPEQYR